MHAACVWLWARDTPLAKSDRAGTAPVQKATELESHQSRKFEIYRKLDLVDPKLEAWSAPPNVRLSLSLRARKIPQQKPLLDSYFGTYVHGPHTQTSGWKNSIRNPLSFKQFRRVAKVHDAKLTDCVPKVPPKHLGFTRPDEIVVKEPYAQWSSEVVISRASADR